MSEPTPYVSMCETNEILDQHTLLETFLKKELSQLKNENWKEAKEQIGLKLAKQEREFLLLKRYGIISTVFNCALLGYIIFRK